MYTVGVFCIDIWCNSTQWTTGMETEPATEHWYPMSRAHTPSVTTGQRRTGSDNRRRFTHSLPDQNGSHVTQGIVNGHWADDISSILAFSWTKYASPPSAAYMRRWTGSSLVQVMEQATIHYLKQCRIIVDWTLRNKFQWNFNRNPYIFIHENAFECVLCETAASKYAYLDTKQVMSVQEYPGTPWLT